MGKMSLPFIDSDLLYRGRFYCMCFIITASDNPF